MAVFLTAGTFLFLVVYFWPQLIHLASDIKKAPLISPSAPLPPVAAPSTLVNDPAVPGTEAYFTALIQKEPANPQWYFQRGLLRYEHRSLTDPVQPIYDDFVTASRLFQEKDPAAIFYRGLVSGNAKDYSKALQLDPQFADALLYRGLNFLRLWEDLDFAGKKEEAKPFADKALADLDRAVDLNPQSGPYRLGRGWAYFCMADMEKAHPDLSEATELIPDNPHAWERFGECLKEEGLEDKAVECHNWALSLGGSISHPERIGALLEKTLPAPPAAAQPTAGKKKFFDVQVDPGFIVAFQSKNQGDGKDPGHISLNGYLRDPALSFTLAAFKKKKADYTTFQSAALSALAADKSGNLKKILESWHPEEREAMKYQLGKTSERRKYLNKLKGVKTIQIYGLVYSSHPLVLIRFNRKTKGGLVMPLRYSEGRWLRASVTEQKADFERVTDVFTSGKGYGKGYGATHKTK